MSLLRIITPDEVTRELKPAVSSDVLAQAREMLCREQQIAVHQTRQHALRWNGEGGKGKTAKDQNRDHELKHEDRKTSPCFFLFRLRLLFHFPHRRIRIAPTTFQR